MNDTAQQPTQNTQSPTQQGQNTQINQSDQVDQKDQSGQNNQAVGSLRKEQGPIVTAPVSEFVKSSEVGPVLHPEVEQAGVQTVSQMPSIPPDAEKAGLALAKEAVPVSTVPSDKIVLPMSEDQAENIVKTQKNTSNSILWLAQEVMKQVKMMHQKIINP